MEGKDVELAEEVAGVGLEVAVGDEVGLEVDECVEVGFVVAVIEGVG